MSPFEVCQLALGLALLILATYAISRREEIAARHRLAGNTKRQQGAVLPANAWLVIGVLWLIVGTLQIAMAIT